MNAKENRNRILRFVSGEGCRMLPIPERRAPRSGFEIPWGPAVRGFGRWQGGEASASPQQAVTAKPTRTPAKRTTAQGVFVQKAAWLRFSLGRASPCSLLHENRAPRDFETASRVLGSPPCDQPSRALNKPVPRSEMVRRSDGYRFDRLGRWATLSYVTLPSAGRNPATPHQEKQSVR